MKKCIVVLTVLFMVIGCSKTRPKKVQRMLLDTEWKLTSYVKDGEAVATTLTDYTFHFGESDLLTVYTDQNHMGSWKVGLDSKPAVIYLNLPAKDGLQSLTDDWKVLEITKEYMRLEVVDNKDDESTILVFRK